MDRAQRRANRVTELISNFSDLVDQYDRTTPFDRDDQIRLHRQTIRIRREHAAPSTAIGDPSFIQSLYSTLQSWGIGSRASVLVPIDRFAHSLARWGDAFDALDHLSIDDPDLDSEQTAGALWQLISGVDIVENKAKIVALSKTIHHILPDLLPPIDRAYTQEFFVLYPIEFQDDQEMAFRTIWDGFIEIAVGADPARFVGSGWRTSRTKVIDNAIIADVATRRGKEDRSVRMNRQAINPTHLSDRHSVTDLYAKLEEFKTELEEAGLKPNTVDTYIGRSKTFIDWLAGTYAPRGPNPDQHSGSL